MTVVAALSTGFDAALAADSRLSYTLADGKVHAIRDVCQKLVHVNAWCALGFAGHACIGGQLVMAFSALLRRTRREQALWLTDDARVRRFVRRVVDTHAAARPTHALCRTGLVELLIARRDHTVPREPTAAGDTHPIELLVVRSPDLLVQRSRGPTVGFVGSGMVAGPEILREAQNGLAGFGQGTVHGHRQRCALLAEMTRLVLRQRKIATVGGGFQLMHLGQERVEAVPYLAFAHVAQDYGTWIAMRVDDGYWVQEHRPTRYRVRLLPPTDIPATGPKLHTVTSQLFDPARMLTRHSPGVLAETNPQMGFIPYRAGPPPPELAGSWGTDPLAPLSWGRPSRRSLLYESPPVPP
jgi:hypothetical protein